MEISKLKLTWKYLTGGISGVLGYALELFNTQILAKADKDTIGIYCRDITAIASLVQGILINHGEKIDENHRVALKALMSTIGDIAQAFQDGKIEANELDALTEEVKACIALFKKG